MSINFHYSLLVCWTQNLSHLGDTADRINVRALRTAVRSRNPSAVDTKHISMSIKTVATDAVSCNRTLVSTALFHDGVHSPQSTERPSCDFDLEAALHRQSCPIVVRVRVRFDESQVRVLHYHAQYTRDHGLLQVM